MASASLSRKTDLLRQLETALGSAHVGTWIGLPSYWSWDDLVPIVVDQRRKNADTIITLGGSSIADAAKAIAYITANDVTTVADVHKWLRPTEADRASGMLERDGVGKDAELTLIFVPTSLSGGEYSVAAGGTNAITKHRELLRNRKMYASLVVLDPAVTITTPFDVWIQSGVRSIDHCVEGICSVGSNPHSDEALSEGLKQLLEGLIRTKANPEDLQARLMAQIGSNKSMTGLACRPVVIFGASHGIGHELGPLGVGHGHTSCIMLPAVLKYNADQADRAKIDIRARQNMIKALVWAVPVVQDMLLNHGLDKDRSDLGDALRCVFRSLGMPSTLREVKVAEDKIAGIASRSMNNWFVKNNPVSLSEKNIVEILGTVSE